MNLTTVLFLNFLLATSVSGQKGPEAPEATLEINGQVYTEEMVWDRLELYEQTPFTTGLTGQSEGSGDNTPDPTNASDMAYCAMIVRRDGFQTRVGSPFSRAALARARVLEEHLDELVIEPNDAELLLLEAEAIYGEAVEYARAVNPMIFNFGGHKRNCIEVADQLSR
ncbi:hypothetical protein [Hyphobacterium indicum]|uniref:hypothetical protein n=1 Tax=Hyphobacterium indicum TaxID=2162714 RepID=UPI000D642F8A|nr:hypothetical protein [Hyphobacterium indicum]|tara:strand:+ start:178 stop:681 length:504 start_codon:yes stop_codon:yes gene_type:complete